MKIGGLGLGTTGTITQTLSDLLSKATPALDQLIGGVLATLGVKLGAADVRVTGASCGRATLVQ